VHSSIGSPAAASLPAGVPHTLGWVLLLGGVRAVCAGHRRVFMTQRSQLRPQLLPTAAQLAAHLAFGLPRFMDLVQHRGLDEVVRMCLKHLLVVCSCGCVGWRGAFV